ncbi:IS256 family transposase [Streptomyces sp. NPDC058992]|uniref:IS256 family transposase n=1 Tax=Streptomyces sp. NPDC058992 TaxID=3346688 RepID=UPI0036CA91AF
MALSQHDLLRLMESLRTADGIELIRVLAQRILQELIEAEATTFIGAEPGEHTETRTNLRNGHRDKVLTTQAGDLDLAIPKVRTGSFFPSLLERRRRIDRALYAVIVEAYVHGVSTRSVDDLVRALGADTGISKSEVSRLCAGLDAELTAFRTRPLDHTRFPYIYLDATYCKARVNHQIVSQAVVIATGITEDGGREVLGLMVGDSETEAFWSEFLRSLRERGLNGVRLVIADHHSGLVKAVRKVMLGAGYQRCRVHFLRNVFAVIPKDSAEMVAATIRTIFAQPDAAAVRAQLDTVADMLGRQFPKVKAMLLEAKEELTAFADFPDRHWKKIQSTNPLERINREIKRRTDVVQIFPNPDALERLTTAVLIEMLPNLEVKRRELLVV